MTGELTNSMILSNAGRVIANNMFYLNQKLSGKEMPRWQADMHTMWVLAGIRNILENDPDFEYEITWHECYGPQFPWFYNGS